MTMAGLFVGPVDIRDTDNGIYSDICAATKFRYMIKRSSNNEEGAYSYFEGVNWGNGEKENPDLDKIRLIVRGGLIVGYTGE
nr:MAG TPA: hypothetical protein [Bacteriophage sp.]